MDPSKETPASRLWQRLSRSQETEPTANPIPADVDPIKWAREPMLAGQWPEATARWQAVIDSAIDEGPVRAHVGLVASLWEQGRSEEAAAHLVGIRDRPQPVLEFEAAWAQQAMVEEDWKEAVWRWNDVLGTFGPDIDPKYHARLAGSHQARGDHGIAEAVLEHARRRYPTDERLLLAWAQAPMAQEDWALAIERHRLVVDMLDGAGAIRAKARLAAAHWSGSDHAAAEQVLRDARDATPNHPDLEMAWAQLALVREDWSVAFERWTSVLEHFESAMDSSDYARLSVAHRRLGDPTSAVAIVERGLGRAPNDMRLLGEHAELAMAEEQWDIALLRWDLVLRGRGSSNSHDIERTKFPARGATNDWYEIAWRHIVTAWDDITSEWPDRPSVLLYRALGRTLRSAGLYADAAALFDLGVRDHPSHVAMAWDNLDLHLLRANQAGTDPRLALTVEATVGAATTLAGRVLADTSRVNAALGASVPGPTGNAIPDIRLLRVPAGSLLELTMKAGHFFSRAIITDVVDRLAVRDEWPEMTSPTNLMVTRARAAADRFGKRFEDLPFLPAATYSDAAFFSIFHELILHTPMERLAAEIDATVPDRSTPIYIQIPRDTFRYLDGYTFSDFDLLYLYAELRRRGRNAFLVALQRVDPDDPETLVPRAGKLSFKPGARALRPRGDEVSTVQHSWTDALIPAGIRSVQRVGEAIGEPLVYTSGSVIKEFAYDRSITQDFPILPEASIHGSSFRMPAIILDLHPLLTVPTTLPGAGEFDVAATVEVSTAIAGDWWSYLDHVLHDFFVQMSRRCYGEIAARGIQTANICDHIFPEGVIYGDAVHALGGRVALWPHSANPVHVDIRRSESFDEVHAVTRTGAAIWRTEHPHADVIHNPLLMLDPPRIDVNVDPSQPLSVVIIGGRSVFRHLPLLDRAAHGTTFTRLFEGLATLQQDHAIDVWFKPRGLTGEHEMWMVDTVGFTASWRRVLEHPLRLDLPNPIFVSISMGSSALLEGLSRGIPGLVVRDFTVRDYTTLDESTFPTLPTDEALALIGECADPTRRQQLLDDELSYYRTELVVEAASARVPG